MSMNNKDMWFFYVEFMNFLLIIYKVIFLLDTLFGKDNLHGWEFQAVRGIELISLLFAIGIFFIACINKPSLLLIFLIFMLLCDCGSHEIIWSKETKDFFFYQELGLFICFRAIIFCFTFSLYRINIAETYASLYIKIQARLGLYLFRWLGLIVTLYFLAELEYNLSDFVKIEYHNLSQPLEIFIVVAEIFSILCFLSLILVLFFIRIKWGCEKGFLTDKIIQLGLPVFGVIKIIIAICKACRTYKDYEKWPRFGYVFLQEVAIIASTIPLIGFYKTLDYYKATPVCDSFCEFLVFNIVILGPKGVGKHQLLQAYYHNLYGEMNGETQILNKSLKISVAPNYRVHFRYTSKPKTCRYADGIILLFNIHDQSSFKKIQKIVEARFKKVWIPLILVGHKFVSSPSRLFGKNSQTVNPRSVSNFASSYRLKYFEVSCDEYESIVDSFNYLLNQLNVLKSCAGSLQLMSSKV